MKHIYKVAVLVLCIKEQIDLTHELEQGDWTR